MCGLNIVFMWRIAENIVHRYVSGARANIGTHARHNSCSWHMEKHMIITKIRNDIYYIRIQNLKSFCCVVVVVVAHYIIVWASITDIEWNNCSSVSHFYPLLLHYL